MFKFIFDKKYGFYFATHDITIRADKNMNVYGGGGGTTIQQPSTPSIGATTRQAIEAEIEALPKRFETELEFRPKFAELDVETLERFSPRILELGRTGAREERALQEELFPEEVGVERKLGQQILGSIDEGIPEDVEGEFLERFRAEEARAGRLGSPVGSVNVSRKLAGLSEGMRAQRVSEALSFANRVPVLGSTGVPRPQAQPTLTGQTVAPALGFASSIFNTQANLAAQQANINLQSKGQNLSLIGAGLGAAGTALGGF